MSSGICHGPFSGIRVGGNERLAGDCHAKPHFFIRFRKRRFPIRIKGDLLFQGYLPGQGMIGGEVASFLLCQVAGRLGAKGCTRC